MNASADNVVSPAVAVKTAGFTQGGIVHAFSGSVEEARIFVNVGIFSEI